MSGSVCLVTVHGIGFQRAPDASGAAGYADQLHAHLRAVLGSDLGDDPERPGGGPVYVSSEWNRSPAQGLARLDGGRALAAPGKIAHLALVYSPSEGLDAHRVLTADALNRAAASHHQYASAIGIVRLLLSDTWAAAHRAAPATPASTLQPRIDLDHDAWPARWRFHRHDGGEDHRRPEVAGVGMLRALEDDIATYLARNEVRERVRGFIQDALLRVLDRDDDIDTVVVNAHSQGTVLCWDVLRRLPFSSWARTHDARAGRVSHFVTAGSPIRKYVDMFAWGKEIGELGTVLPSGALSWTNFCDPRDPIADPLNPPETWRPGQPWDQPPEPDGGLLIARRFDDGSLHHVTVIDHRVDNLTHSTGGGLQAHDYWNNTAEFVPELAKLLAGVRASED